MSLFGTLLRTTIHAVTTPVDLIKDLATLGGTLTDKDKSYTTKKIEKLKDDIEDLEDEVDDLD